MKKERSIKTNLVETFDTVKDIVKFILMDKPDYMSTDYAAAAPQAFKLKAEASKEVEDEAKPSSMET